MLKAASWVWLGTFAVLAVYSDAGYNSLLGLAGFKAVIANGTTGNPVRVYSIYDSTPLIPF